MPLGMTPPHTRSAFADPQVGGTRCMSDEPAAQAHASLERLFAPARVPRPVPQTGPGERQEPVSPGRTPALLRPHGRSGAGPHGGGMLNRAAPGEPALGPRQEQLEA
jgi:hypothetical protein